MEFTYKLKDFLQIFTKNIKKSCKVCDLHFPTFCSTIFYKWYIKTKDLIKGIKTSTYNKLLA